LALVRDRRAAAFSFGAFPYSSVANLSPVVAPLFLPMENVAFVSLLLLYPDISPWLLNSMQ
jgi:hypothetical protein